MGEIISIKTPEEKIKKLEDYLLSKHTGFKHPFLHAVMEDMLEADPCYTVKEIAAKYKISRKTLYKHFEMHIGKNPTEMRKLIRFRHAIKEQVNINQKHNFCDLSYKLEFFDASHLSKDFRAITGHTPRVFFKKVSPLNEGAINWLFM